jgi:hypothetical protein
MLFCERSKAGFPLRHRKAVLRSGYPRYIPLAETFVEAVMIKFLLQRQLYRAAYYSDVNTINTNLALSSFASHINLSSLWKG